MKKLLMIAVLSLFAVSAFAANVNFYGEYELGGEMILNNTLGDDSDANKSGNSTYWKHKFRVGADINIDKVTISVRSTPVDQRFGESLATVAFDRAYATYQFTDAFSMTGGRASGGSYETAGFGTGWYDVHFEESGGRHLIRADYTLNKDVSVFFVTEKRYESSFNTALEYTNTGNGADKNGLDDDAYVFGANMSFGDVYLTPRLALASTYNVNSLNSDKRTNFYSVYVGGGLNADQGLNIVAAAAFITGKNNGTADTLVNLSNNKFEDYTAYGFFIEPTFVADRFAAGLTFAYASYDKKKGYFQFGGDFDRTIIMDDGIGGGSYGVPAMTTIQAFADIALTEKINVMPRVAYYFSNVQGSAAENYAIYTSSTPGRPFGAAAAVGKDTKAFEVDLAAEYQWTDSTVLYAGAAYAKIDDGGPTPVKYSPDGITKLKWEVVTVF